MGEKTTRIRNGKEGEIRFMKVKTRREGKEIEKY